MRVIQVLCERLRSTTARAGELAYLDVQQRLAYALLDLSGRHGVECHHGTQINLRMTQSDLAAMLGASRESVNRALSSLRDRGLVRQRGKRMVVPCRDALRDEARSEDRA